MSHLENRPVYQDYRRSPTALAGYIDRFGVNSQGFISRVPFLMAVGLDNQFEIWKRDGFPNYSAFGNVLGLWVETEGFKNAGLAAHSPYNLYYRNRKEISMTSSVENPYLPEFEGKLATQLCNYFVQKLSNRELIDGDLNLLAGFLVGAQLVTTNLIASPEYAYVYLKNKYGDKSFFLNFPTYGRNILFPDINKKLRENIYQLFFNHQKALLDGFESDVRLPRNALQAFFNIIGNEKTVTGRSQGLDGDSTTHIEVEKLLHKLQSQPHAYYPEVDEEVQFAGRYMIGLGAFAQGMIEGKENGVLYIYDHLKMVMERMGIFPTDINEIDNISVEEWKEKLFTCLEDPGLFDFLHGENKVREIIGRYDYRGLIDYLTSQKKRDLSVVSLGFGKVGAAAWELKNTLHINGISADVIGVDILPSRVIEKDQSKISITQLKRTESGVLEDRNHDQMPDLQVMSSTETRDIITWHNDLVNSGKLIGNVDLIGTSPDIPKADVVTLQGTVACLHDYDKREKMIDNALKLVNPNGGILLIEGGMTLTGGQSINSIAIRLNNGKTEVLYIEINRSRGVVVPSGYVADAKTLLVNKDAFQDGLKPNGGENYFAVSFSNGKEFIPAMFNAINNDKLAEHS